MKLPKFKSKKEKFAYLKKNEKKLIASKKKQMKKASGFLNLPVVKMKTSKTKTANKSAGDGGASGEYIDVTVVISTTNVRDSHKDVHIDGWADDQLKDSSAIMHLQEHDSESFSKIISDGDDLQVYTKNTTWKKLGFDLKGDTEALFFKSRIWKERNPEMFKNYSRGWVKNHSVGMYYIDLSLALDSEEEEHEKNKSVYDKYINKIVNKKEVEKDGFFWAVEKAGIFEGSSVPAGSNSLTPTTSVSSVQEKTHKKKKVSSYEKALKKATKKLKKDYKN